MSFFGFNLSAVNQRERRPGAAKYYKQTKISFSVIKKTVTTLGHSSVCLVGLFLM